MVSHGSNAMRRIYLLLSATIIAIAAFAQRFNVNEGDLAFVIVPQGNAITQVTQGIESLPIDHVAIMHRIGGNDGLLYALEAVPNGGVCLTPIDSFLCANGVRNVIIGRIDDLDASRSVRKALSYVGLPYDFNYLPDDSSIYCSELVQKSYVNNAGEPVFNTIPMSFHDASGNIIDYWKQHYASQGLEVPEGAPGTNPGQLSRHPRVTVIPFRF